MKIASAVAVLVFVSGVTSARAQEEPAAPPSKDRVEAADTDQAEEAQARPHIQVLRHPYEISSFYRSKQEPRYDLYGYGPGYGYGYGPGYGSEPDGRYPIAGFYRSGAASRGAYSAFWTAGYGHGAMRGTGGRMYFAPGHARSLGRNGDLCLFAPTFLAPVGPLTGVFWDR